MYSSWKAPFAPNRTRLRVQPPLSRMTVIGENHVQFHDAPIIARILDFFHEHNPPPLAYRDPMTLRFVTPQLVLCACLAVPLVSGAQTIKNLDGHTLSAAAIDHTIETLMQANDVKGLTVALIRDGRVVYLHGFGVRDAQNAPLTPDTVMYGASQTKATFAWMVMQLVDEGKIDLDRSIALYLPKPLPDYPKYADFANDPRWRQLTFRILLDHTTGLANFYWAEPDGKLRFHNDPGVRFGYSGEGLNLAQFVLENGLGLDVGARKCNAAFSTVSG